MNSLLWTAQIVLAGVFLYAGLSKILVFRRPPENVKGSGGSACVGMPDELAAAIAFLEIAGSLGVLIPMDLWPPDILLRISAAGLGLLAVITCIYQVRRREHTTPTITAILLSLFVIVGRWPR